MLNGNSLRFIRCQLGDESYGLDMNWVSSIQRTERFRPNLKADDILGWVPYQNQEVPVFSLAGRLGAPVGEVASWQRIIVLNDPVQPCAMLVDRVSQVNQVPGDQLLPLPSLLTMVSVNLFRGVIRLDEELLLLLDPAKLHAAPSPPEPASESPAVLLPPHAPAAVLGDRHGQLLRFTLPNLSDPWKDITFGLSITQVPEIVESLPLIRVPLSPDYILGLGNWRHRPVPVINLARRLGLQESARAAQSTTRLLITRTPIKDSLLGFPVHQAIQVLSLPLPEAALCQPLPLDHRFVYGEVMLEDKPLVIPNLQAVVT